MSEVNMPLAQVRTELEKLGFRDLPEHLLVSFMQSILSEEAATSTAPESHSSASSSISETRDGNFLRSNGGCSSQSASATFASAALKTRVSGRKVTILSPSKDIELGPSQIAMQEGRPQPPGHLQQEQALLHEQHRRPSQSDLEELRPSADHHSNAKSSNSKSSVQQASGQDTRDFHSVPSAHASKLEPARPAASTVQSAPAAAALLSGAAFAVSDENTVPASERLEAANNALRAAIGSKSSSLKSHSSSSSVIFVAAGPTRPRSRHDPVKAFQNHVSSELTHLCPSISYQRSIPTLSPFTGGRVGHHSPFASVVCRPRGAAAHFDRPTGAALASIGTS
jgi:hypothetical protein